MNHWITTLAIMMTLSYPTAFSAPSTQPNQPTSTATGNPGNNNGNNNNSGPTIKVTTAQCTAVANKLQPVGNTCLKTADFNARATCFNNAPGKVGVDNNVMNACMQSNSPPLNALRASLQAQEKKLYPNQQSALDNHGGNNNQNLPTMTAAQCTAIAAKLAPQGNACVKIADFDQRVNCVNNAPGKAGVDQNQMNSCGKMGLLDSLKNSLIAQEKKLHPNQGSAFDNHGNNNGPNNGGPNNGPSTGNNNQQVSPFPAAQCTSLLPKLQDFAASCLKQKDFQARSSCFQSADSQFPPGFFNGGCSQQIQPVKDSIQLKEHQLYPDQPSALH